MKQDVEKFKSKIQEILFNRGVLQLNNKGLLKKPTVSQLAWFKHLTAHAWLSHSINGDGFEMLDLLMDRTQLSSGEKFNSNFVMSFADFAGKKLRANKTWNDLVPTLVEFKGKGVGVGEMYLGLVVQGWNSKRTNGKGDGYVSGGIREIKNNGASLKPVKNRVTAQDKLNATLFEGHRAGPPTKFHLHREWIQKTGNAEKIYLDYFTQLYPGQDVTAMCNRLAAAKDWNTFSDIIGKQVLKWYQKIDSWQSLIIIDQDNMKIANIADLSDEGLSDFTGITFDWKSERGGDTQALSDGYVNVRI